VAVDESSTGWSNFETGVTTLYPLIGTLVSVFSIGYLIFGIIERSPTIKEASATSSLSKEPDTTPMTTMEWTFLGLLCVFFFFYVGIEVSYGIFLTAFAVESRQKLSQQVGAEITAIFWGCFAAMRFISIFASMKIQAIYIMIFSCVTSLIGMYQ
jgi:fucose permease